ncbi:MAG: HD domain-containing protein [Candidatus Izemoplasma sp.]
MKLLDKAIKQATGFHQGQIRKYSGDEYITHPIAVKDILVGVGIIDEDILSAAVLHDCPEDTNMTLNFIAREYNHNICTLVFYSSSITQLAAIKGLSRALRKKMDRKHYCNGHIGNWLIKVADALHNSRGIY